MSSKIKPTAFVVLSVLLIWSTSQVSDVSNAIISQVAQNHITNLERDALQVQEAKVLPSQEETLQSSKRNFDELTSESNYYDDEELKKPFILLSTGSEIKIYPIEEANNDNSNGLDCKTSSKSYLVKSSEFDGKIREAIEQDLLSSHWPLTHWLLRKASQKSNNSATQSILPRRKSNSKAKGEHQVRNLLPQREEDEEDLLEYGREQWEWQRPHISEVDYLVVEGKSFCNGARDSRCLLIAWLDKKNNIIRIGSFGFGSTRRQVGSDGNETSSSRKEAHRNSRKTIWLREFAPISGPRRSKFHTFAIDKESGRIYTLVSIERLKEVYIYSGKLIPNGSRWMPFEDEESLPIQTCTSWPLDIRSLQIGQTNTEGKWLFYLEKDANLSRPVAVEVTKKQIRTQYNYMSFIWNSAEDEANVLAMAIDAQNYLLYRLLDNNMLYRHEVDSSNYELVGQLSPKPSLRTVDTMQVDGQLVYFSDPIRRAISVYKLPSASSTNGSDTTAANMTSGRQLIEQVTHKVLLIEMPTITGFRVFNWPNYKRANIYSPNIVHKDYLKAYRSLEVSADERGYYCSNQKRNMQIKDVCFVLICLLILLIVPLLLLALFLSDWRKNGRLYRIHAKTIVSTDNKQPI